MLRLIYSRMNYCCMSGCRNCPYQFYLLINKKYKNNC